MSYTVKDRAGFVVHGSSLEAPLQNQSGYLTPNSRFFVCNSGTTPQIDAETYKLRIWGDGVTRELTLSYGDLLKLPQHTVPALLECAGNHRAFFRDVKNETLITPAGTTELIWSTGAVGMAEWQGVSLADVLSLADVREGAIQICPRGSESDSCEVEIRMPLPIEKALDRDTLLAVKMNGEQLPADHGYPVRVLVPGWIGAYSVKWVQDIEVRTTPLWVRRNTTQYILEGEPWPPELYAPSNGQRIEHSNIKSSLALPLPATLPAGDQTLHGYARSPGSQIAQVLWSCDDGANWIEATLGAENGVYGWVRFEFEWTASTGEHRLMTRAVDKSGKMQPMTIAFNRSGYMYNAVHPHPVVIV